MAKSKAITAPKPDFGGAGLNWQNEGWKVDVAYWALPNPVRPKDHFEEIAHTLGEKYSPLNRSGKGVQAYFFPVGNSLQTGLIKLLDGQYESAFEFLTEQLLQPDLEHNVDDSEAILEEMNIQQRLDIGETQRTQLVIARRGQGVYRNNVRLVENSCRITGLALSQHLVASHIKPWSKSDDLEKLDGFNGLLLSPHIDHLFDKGFISFTNQGTVLTAQNLHSEVLDKWHLEKNQQVGQFSVDQSKYLEYHRDMIFEGALSKSN